MKRTTLLSVASAVIAVGVISVAGYGCGDDDNVTPTGKDAATNPIDSPSGDTSMNADTSTGFPTPPTLGTQIDRMGRPAVNTALNATFELDATKKGQSKDKYNQDIDLPNWGKNWITQTAGNLAVLDSLNSVCGDQFLAGDSATGPATVTYATFGGVAADDRLWLNTAAVPAAGTTSPCTTYLAVEANYAANAGLLPAILKNTDCGGRMLDYDVIDITYSVAAAASVTGVTDGIAKDDVKTSGNGTATAGGALAFPYLAPAVQ